MARKPTAKPAAPAPVARGRGEARARILEAAHAVMSERGYLSASVDEIATRAGVSRPTFYAYFSDKIAVAFALSENLEKETLRTYRKLAALGPSPKLADLRDWVSRRVADTRRRSSLIRIFGQVTAAEPGFYRITRGHRSAVFTMLGERIPAFAAAAAAPKSIMAVRAHMLLDQLELLCSMIALDWDGESDIAIDLMAEQIAHFIHLPAA